jgi:peptidyl-tRNA hydrolase, PTH1 family
MQDKSLYMVLGLGNPGRAYAATRHNAGFRIADKIALSFGVSFKRKWGVPFYFCRHEVEDKDVVLIKPRTYMNNSGMGAASAMKRFGINGDHVIVIMDDVWLPLGSIRIRKKGSAGGHNGLASVIEALGTDEIVRCRAGIGGSDCENLAEFVLGRFSEEEEKVFQKVILQAADAVIGLIKNGVESAMNQYNSIFRDVEENEKAKN